MEPGEAGEGGNRGALGRIRASAMITFSTCIVQILVLSPALPRTTRPHICFQLPNHSDPTALCFRLSCPVTHFPQPGTKPLEARLSLHPSRISPRHQNGASEASLCNVHQPKADDVQVGVPRPTPGEKSARAWGYRATLLSPSPRPFLLQRVKLTTPHPQSWSCLEGE